MKKIVALVGEGDTGKSTVIRQCFDTLVKEMKAANIGYRQNPDPLRAYKEVFVAITVKEKTVVINSLGDTGTLVQNGIDMAEAAHADMLVAATRPQRVNRGPYHTLRTYGARKGTIFEEIKRDSLKSNRNDENDCAVLLKHIRDFLGYAKP